MVSHSSILITGPHACVLTATAIEQSLAEVAHPARLGAGAAQLAAVSPMFLPIAKRDSPDESKRLLACDMAVGFQISSVAMRDRYAVQSLVYHIEHARMEETALHVRLRRTGRTRGSCNTAVLLKRACDWRLASKAHLPHLDSFKLEPRHMASAKFDITS